MATLLVCDGSSALRRSLTRRASVVPGVDRVDTAATAAEVFMLLDARRERAGRAADYDGGPGAATEYAEPEIVLLDAHLPPSGAVAVLRRLMTDHPRAAVFVLGTGEDAEAVADAMAYGARGVLHKDLSHEELAAAVAHALAAPAVRTPAPRPSRPDVVLTTRELQVLCGMCEGKSNSEIGRDLYLSEDTVKTHARRLYRKLGVNDRAHAVASGFRLGLVS
jgi:DNA-binding NarL/FixJ family response regulator